MKRILSVLLCLVMVTTVFAMTVSTNVNSGDAGLIAYWSFDEGSGGIAYDSAGSNDGTIYGASWVDGISGHALSFDGVDDYIEVPDSDALDRFIDKKLKEAGHGLKENRIDVIINPDDELIIKDGQGAILIV